MIKNNLSDLETNEEKEITIGIDLGTTYSCAAIYRKKKKDVDVIAETQSGIRSQPSIVCFKNNNECLIGISAKRNMLEYPESTIFDRKGLLDHKFSNQYIQKDIKNYHVKIIEDPTS